MGLLRCYLELLGNLSAPIALLLLSISKRVLLLDSGTERDSRFSRGDDNDDVLPPTIIGSIQELQDELQVSLSSNAC